MTARPILFSSPMVRALLDGRKTQTRRALKQQPLDIIPLEKEKRGREWVSLEQRVPEPHGRVVRCRYGLPGDLLWVRETWAQPTDQPLLVYRADYPACVPRGVENVPPADDVTWRPSIHMKRVHSRITLRITDVRVERLQSISQEDAIAEGIAAQTGPFVHHVVADYRRLWGEINGKASWDANPWVWVISFDVLKQNVDQVVRAAA